MHSRFRHLAAFLRRPCQRTLLIWQNPEFLSLCYNFLIIQSSKCFLDVPSSSDQFFEKSLRRRHFFQLMEFYLFRVNFILSNLSLNILKISYFREFFRIYSKSFWFLSIDQQKFKNFVAPPLHTRGEKTYS